MTSAGQVSMVLPSADEIESLDGAELDVMLWELEQARRRVEATIALVVDRGDRTLQYAADGHRGVRSWVMAVTNCSPGEATARRRTADVMSMLPTVRDEFVAGRVGVAQINELGRLAANPRCADQLAGSEQVLLDAAQGLQFLDFRTVARRWEQLADADGASREHDRSLEYRNASLVHVDGEFRWDTRHGVIHGTVMQEIFAKFCEAEFRADWEATVALHGAAACPALMPRTAAQRRADAMVAVFEAAASAGIGGVPVDVVVNLVMDEDQFEQYLGEGVDGTPVEIDPAGVRDRRCETIDGVPVDPRQAVALAFMGQVRRIVVDSANVIVNAGRLRRLYTGVQRDVLQALNPRCTWLGCTIRAAIADIDHVTNHSEGGLTDIANAAIGCKHHNLFKYRHGYSARRDAHGHWHITRPDGTELRPPDTQAEAA